MRTTTEIKAEIDTIRKAMNGYNRLVNEGGEGYVAEDQRIPALAAEFIVAQSAEFAAEWTVETTAARRAAWNAEVAPLVAAGKPVKPEVVKAVETKLGYTLADIARAKKLHGIA